MISIEDVVRNGAMDLKHVVVCAASDVGPKDDILDKRPRAILAEKRGIRSMPVVITPLLVQTMSDYNRWQNTSIFSAADTLSSAERARSRGAFWGSIEATLNHVLWGDRLWLSRLGQGTPPKGTSMLDTIDEGGDWESLKKARREQDAAIADWAASVEQVHLDASFTYVSAAIGKEFTQNIGLLTVHMFNHQTHHRGQVHAMLTAAGATPEDTDIPFMPGLPSI